MEKLVLSPDAPVKLSMSVQRLDNLANPVVNQFACEDVLYVWRWRILRTISGWLGPGVVWRCGAPSIFIFPWVLSALGLVLYIDYADIPYSYLTKSPSYRRHPLDTMLFSKVNGTSTFHSFMIVKHDASKFRISLVVRTKIHFPEHDKLKRYHIKALEHWGDECTVVLLLQTHGTVIHM